MLDIIISQLPPTPTPFAPSAPGPITIPGTWNIWAFSDDVIQWWNHPSWAQWQPMIQYAVIILLLVFIILWVVNMVRGLGEVTPTEEK